MSKKEELNERKEENDFYQTLINTDFDSEASVQEAMRLFDLFWLNHCRGNCLEAIGYLIDIMELSFPQ